MVEQTKVSGIPEAFIIGTLIYLFLGLVVCTGVTVKVKGSSARPGTLGMLLILVTIGTFSIWILWAMTWLMQWHPLIAPEEETTTE